MKNLLFISVLFIMHTAASQNVGIGTEAPQATLDIKGNHRMGGLSSFVTYDSTTGRIEWKNSNLYVPVTQALMKHSAAADGLFYNNTTPVSGQLEYRNAAGEPVFFTNFTNGNGYFKNYLGIGTTTPFTNLQIESTNNFPVIVNGASNLFLSWAENNVYRGYLGSFAGNPEDVDFGTYSSNITGKIHFTTGNIPRMTISPPGNVGIGTTDPTNPLSFPAILSKKISLYPGGSGDVGMGVSGNLLKIYADHPNADVAFGYDDFTNGFTERMRVRGNGNVGISTATPSEKLEVNGNIKASAYKLTAPKTLYYSVDQSAFTARDGSQSVQKTFGQGGVFVLNGNNYGVTAPVNLPHGAAITKITVGFYDVVAAQDLQATFNRFHATAGAGFISMATLTSTGSGGIQSATYIFPAPLVIDNSIFSYSLIVTPTSGNWTNFDLLVKGVVIEYTVSEL